MVIQEFMGFEKDIYSMFHYKDVTITIVQDANGTLLAVSYETDDFEVEELSL